MKEFFFIYASNVEFPKGEDVTEFAFTTSRGYIPVWEEDQDLKIEDFKYLFDVNEDKGRDIICSISKSYNLYRHEKRANPLRVSTKTSANVKIQRKTLNR